MKKQWIAVLLIGFLLTGCAGKTKEASDMVENAQTEESGSVEQVLSSEENESNLITEKVNQDAVDAIILYEKFLGLQESDTEISASMDELYESNNEGLGYTFESGDTLTFSDLKDYINSAYLEVRGAGENEFIVSYAYIDCGEDGKNELAIKFTGLNIYDVDDDSYAVFIVTERDKELYITYSFSCWARSELSLNTYGYCTGGGSAGAGDYIYNAKILDENGRCQSIYEAEELSGWWVNYIHEESYNKIFSEDQEPDMFVAKYHVGEEDVCTYGMYSETEEDDELNQMFIEECEKAGIVWRSQEEIDEMIENRESAMGISASTKKGEYPEWIVIE